METNFSLLLLPGTRWNQVSHWDWPEPAMGSLRVWLEHSGVGTAVLRQGWIQFCVNPSEPHKEAHCAWAGLGSPSLPTMLSTLCLSCLGNNGGSTPSANSKLCLQGRSPIRMLFANSMPPFDPDHHGLSPADLQSTLQSKRHAM